MTSEVVQVTEEQLGIREGEEFDRQLDFDLGNLCASHPGSLAAPGTTLSEEELADAATRVAQSLIKKIFLLPRVVSEDGPVASLPPPLAPLPRAKPIPKPRPLTKWQKFAKEKGIVKKKRSKLVFDDGSQEWKRRHGYGRGNDPLDVPIIEASDADKDGEDPFSRLERERKSKMKGSKAAGRNAEGGSTKPGALPATVKLATRLDGAGKIRGQIAKGREMKGDIEHASALAGVSTASMGKFDKKLRGEKGPRRPPGARSAPLPVAAGDAERTLVGKVAANVARSREGDLINVRRAVGKLEAEERAASHAADADGGEVGEGARSRKGRVGRVKNRRVPKKPKAPAGGVAKRGGKGGKGGKGKAPRR